ncbi:MAG TPA: ABC transporter ATP-binding protein, partial [Chloroflexota bacterium]|nr:ABC transporter ATP-binding protein [Chloroflexota bacterium]
HPFPSRALRALDLGGGPAGREVDPLLLAAGLYLGVTCVAYGLNIVATYAGEDVGWTATNALRADLTAHCLGLDLAFHEAHTPGELIERLDGDVQVLARLFSQLALRVAGNLLLLAGVLVALWHAEPRVGLTAFLLAGAALLALTRLRTTGVTAWQAEREASASLYGFLEERLAGTVDLRANGATGHALHRLAGLMETHFLAEVEAWRRTALPRTLVAVLSVLATALALGLGGWLTQRGTITLGTLALIYAYITLLFAPLFRIGTEVEHLQAAEASIRRIEELARRRSTLGDGTARLPGGPLAVDFEGVTFSYAGRHAPVIHDLTFHLAAGRSLGLLGRTGRGKTTVTRLLLRLYEPQAGTIRLGGRTLRSVQQRELRRRVAAVTQDVQLFSATVRDNVTFFERSIPDERILAVLHDLGLGEWFRRLPHGLDTVIGGDAAAGPAGPMGLSAGEAQLLAFARVFLLDPGVVILDEASSRLDPATERLIERAVERLLRGRTAIVIAHRLGTIRRVDEILILEDGRVQEHGGRAALASDPASAFARLWRSGQEGQRR